MIYRFPNIIDKYSVYKKYKDFNTLSIIDDYGLFNYNKNSRKNYPEIYSFIYSHDNTVRDCYKKRKHNIIERIVSVNSKFNYTDYENKYILDNYKEYNVDMINYYRNNLTDKAKRKEIDKEEIASLGVAISFAEEFIIDQLLNDYKGKADFSDINKTLYDCVNLIKGDFQKIIYDYWIKSLILSIFILLTPPLCIYIVFWVVIPWIIRGFMGND